MRILRSWPLMLSSLATWLACAANNTAGNGAVDAAANGGTTGTIDGAAAIVDQNNGRGGAGGTSAIDVSPSDTSVPPLDTATAGTPDRPSSPDTALTAPDTAAPPDTASPSDTSAGAFNPCPPAGTPCRIMPLGDSITHGIGSTSGAGYRVPLFQRALAARRAITFVGSDQNGPTTVEGVPFPQQHEGHRMFIIDTVGTRAGLIPLINDVVTTHQPHIVTLMIGTNDAGSSAYATEAPRRMGALLDRIYAAAPNALVVVAKIIPTTDDARNQVVTTFNNALLAVVTARAAAGKAILLVDMHQPFVSQADYKTALMADSLHPNEAGFAKMAEVWWNAVQPYLRESRAP